MKAVVVLALTLVCHTMFAQTAYSFKEVGWSIELPEDFEKMDDAALAPFALKGTDAAEQDLVKKFELNKAKNLIGAAKDKYNFFNASVNYSPAITASNWQQADKAAKQIYFNSFNQQIRFIKVDTTNTVLTIDGQDFQKFEAVCYINSNNTFTAVYITKFFKGHLFTISYYFMDYSAGQELDKMIAGSKFE